jgi:hypothetical protein
MNANIYPGIRQRGWSGRRRLQWGGEIIEATLLLFPFFLVCFLIIDMAVMMFDQGLINHAARYGARQGSLYWVDPSDYDLTDPRGNIRVKEAMINTAVSYYFNNALINPGKAPLNPPYAELLPPDEVEEHGSVPNRWWSNVSNARAAVQLTYPHDFIGLTRVLGFSGMTMDADTGLSTESDL